MPDITQTQVRCKPALQEITVEGGTKTDADSTAGYHAWAHIRPEMQGARRGSAGLCVPPLEGLNWTQVRATAANTVMTANPFQLPSSRARVPLSSTTVL